MYNNRFDLNEFNNLFLLCHPLLNLFLFCLRIHWIYAYNSYSSTNQMNQQNNSRLASLKKFFVFVFLRLASYYLGLPPLRAPLFLILNNFSAVVSFIIIIVVISHYNRAFSLAKMSILCKCTSWKWNDCECDAFHMYNTMWSKPVCLPISICTMRLCVCVCSCVSLYHEGVCIQCESNCLHKVHTKKIHELSFRWLFFSLSIRINMRIWFHLIGHIFFDRMDFCF